MTSGKARLQPGARCTSKVTFPTDKATWHASLLTDPIVLVSTVDATGEPNIAASPGVRNLPGDHDGLPGL